MNKLLIAGLLIFLSCNPDNRQTSRSSNQFENNPCPPAWTATGKNLKQIKSNDSTEQVFLNDTLWFEIIGNSTYQENRTITYIKNYRTNGQLENEGQAIYFDHPIADYEEHGDWKYYDCYGELIETKKYFEGELVNAN